MGSYCIVSRLKWREISHFTILPAILIPRRRNTMLDIPSCHGQSWQTTFNNFLLIFSNRKWLPIWPRLIECLTVGWVYSLFFAVWWCGIFRVPSRRVWTIRWWVDRVRGVIIPMWVIQFIPGICMPSSETCGQGQDLYVFTIITVRYCLNSVS